MKKLLACLMVVFIFLTGVLYINKKQIGYVLDYLYFIRVVEENSFSLNNIPNSETKKIYLRKMMDCENNSDFFNILQEYYLNYESTGHLNLVDVESYNRMYKTYTNLIKDKIINQDNWNYKILMNKQVRNSYLKQTSYSLNEISIDGINCYNDGDFFVIQFQSFDLNYLNWLELIESRLQNFQGNKIIIDVSKNEGGSDIVWQKLVSNLSYKDYQYKTKIIGHGELSRKYVTSYGIDVQGNESKFSYIDCIDIKSNRLHDFKDIYVIIGDKTFSAADSFARFAKETGFATVIGKESAGFGTGLDPMLLKLPHTNVLFMLDAVGKQPATTNPQYNVDNTNIGNVEKYIKRKIV